MENYNIYEDIATRTQGALYIGVVGPVRTGKSTFIKRFPNSLSFPPRRAKSVRRWRTNCPRRRRARPS